MTTHRAAVCGSPIRHSLSPVLHDAAYRALGLTNWTYGRIHIEAEELAEWVHSLDDSWRGLSLTMPLKEAAFAVAHTVSEVAEAVGAINTLVRDDDGWSGHNTDVYGIVRALAEAGVTDITHAVVVGSGATARSALAALPKSARLTSRSWCGRLSVLTPRRLPACSGSASFPSLWGGGPRTSMWSSARFPRMRMPRCSSTCPAPLTLRLCSTASTAKA